MEKPVIALLTDFGTEDPYVGVMKGVIAAHCPEATVIDISHAVQPQNIRQGAYRLWTAYRYFPARTIFVAVVDPGVGTSRRPIAVQTEHGVFVGPDNGLFSAVLSPSALGGTRLMFAVALYPKPHMSATFHGRDLFAPVGAAIACGAHLTDFGTAIDNVIRVDVLKAEQTQDGLVRGEVMDIDRFGNVITSLGPCELISDPSAPMLKLFTSRENNVRTQPVIFDPHKTSVRIGDQTVAPIQTTYGSAPPGNLLALINSAGMIEVAVNGGNVAERLDVAIGDTIEVTFR